eukprot:363759-Chlamydomonas_euryale.AAC.4
MLSGGFQPRWTLFHLGRPSGSAWERREGQVQRDRDCQAGLQQQCNNNGCVRHCRGRFRRQCQSCLPAVLPASLHQVRMCGLHYNVRADLADSVKDSPCLEQGKGLV